ncbi:homoserine dehydrogenase [Neomegalonema sp.]|uniref:homoserine dehydrogenase n=1 Tax=Neomegalonema sp. TaxID=2039713 RepID=UPI00260168C0|nr:homoserine dehydrogenase [Neomegalonema sp.]MDD2868878.1 homoserine dehydrogenase [Neomegalonema sp.]
MRENGLRVGLAGLGTVGGGVVRLLRDRAEALTARGGGPLALTAVAARDRSRDRGFDLSGAIWHEDPVALARSPEIDVFVEVMGGSEGPARDSVEAALKAGKSVVTANKALLAVHGGALARLAEANGAQLRYEAAVAGGAPAIKLLREGLAANEVSRVYGVLNGTCAYIISEMESSGRDYPEILAEAQALGYAEADPTADVGGFDAANKLAILAAIAFGAEPDLSAMEIEGVDRLSVADIDLAKDLGYRIRLLGVAARHADGRLEQRVSPCLVPAKSDIARLKGVTNAVGIEAEPVGRIFLTGPGAGAGPTASAAVADLLDLARGDRRPVFGVAAADLAPIRARPIEDHTGRFYLRFLLQDRPGALASVTAALGAENVSIESMRQLRPTDQTAPAAIVTHEAREGDLRRALARIGALPALAQPPVALRIEEI